MSLLALSWLQFGAADAAPAGSTAPPVPATDAPQTPRVGPPFTFHTTDDCQTVKAKIKAHAFGSQGQVACITRVAAGEKTKVPASGTIPVPSWCENDVIKSTRFEVCGMSRWDISVVKVPSGTPSGGMRVNQLGYLHADYDKIDWQYEAVQTFENIWGDAEGTTVSATGWCHGDCLVENQFWPTQIAKPSVPGEEPWEGYVVGVSNKFQANEIGDGVLGGETTLSNPKWTNLKLSNAGDAPNVRCDNVLWAQQAAGCAVSGVIPEMFYELNGPYPELARHIKQAQAKGLPGVIDRKPPAPLTRAMDQKVRRANNRAACPDSLPRPEGEDCDEYPFASTWQGAAFGPYDIEMINAKQNEDGGTALNKFFNQNRVIEETPFWVTIR
ncbi:NucA/NucB deoxyribonuclease domain-containing protein [Amycolatopsis sp. VC5-11]|uniref:NucA/NucB deoxyribonuclease domain-containing protein n=1 Tax=Amycolatopsis sp. VC5-11 TaxID=3120156 RepID=UPI0030098D6A